MALLMMVGLTFEDGESPVKLFHKDQSYHLVGEGHGRERQFGLGFGVDLGGEAVGAANHEHQPFRAGGRRFFEVFGKCRGAVLTAMLVEQDHMVARLQLRQEEVALRFFLLFLVEGLAVADVGNLFHLEGNVMAYPPDILLDAGDEVVLIRFPYDEKEDFHSITW